MIVPLGICILVKRNNAYVNEDCRTHALTVRYGSKAAISPERHIPFKFGAVVVVQSRCAVNGRFRSVPIVLMRLARKVKD